MLENPRKVEDLGISSCQETSQAEVKLPGRCTMQELLEYSRRNTAVQGGK